ncbi:MAG: NADP-dependent isocitrate dehydrogenase [Parachlamydiales bacterium]
MAKKIPITVAHGDGIGPEIMEATLHILKEAGAPLEIETVEIGEKVYKSGHLTGIEPKTWESLRRTKVFLKAPITTPQGGGFKSLNVTVRTSLGLYANVRPCVAYHPFVKTKHPGMDVVIIRENEEDLYCGIEYHQTPDTFQSLKILSRPGSEKICHYAFEYAKANGRKKVTCFTKDNIMKISDGLFHQVFDEVAAHYPDIENEHWIVDIGAAKLADTPEAFDVIVLPNLYGDILSDVAAQIAGSVGLAGSANIGEHGAMFEAIHGSAPRRAGQNLANPSGLLLGSVLMLNHIGLPDTATQVHNAWLTTLEQGIHTYDIFKEGVSKEKVGTREFAQAVAKNLGKEPQQLKAVHYKKGSPTGTYTPQKAPSQKKTLQGVDVFIQWEGDLDALRKKLAGVKSDLTLSMISNRGVKVWPEGMTETFCIDQWRCRYSGDASHLKIAHLLQNLADLGLDFIKTENLYAFDGKGAYTGASS